jgi:acyl transferase domain-containing protein
LHADIPNPNIDFAATPFVLSRALRAWEQPVIDGKAVLRTAGLSSFGAGGSNAHLIVQEYDGRTARPRLQPERPGPVLIVLSAKTDPRLREKLSELFEFIQSNPALRLRDLAYTLQVGRKAMPQRVAFAADSRSALLHKLQAILSRPEVEGVHWGEVKYRKSTPAASPAANGTPSAVQECMAAGDLAKLAQLWVNGASLDWSLLYADSRPFRIPLPTYPFARDRYWIGISPAEPSATPAALSAGNGNGHHDESFHSQMLDRLLAGQINVEDAIQQARDRDHGD